MLVYLQWMLLLPNDSDDNPWYTIIIANAVWHSAVHHRPMVELWIQNIQL